LKADHYKTKKKNLKDSHESEDESAELTKINFKRSSSNKFPDLYELLVNTKKQKKKMRALKKKIYYEAKVNECKSSALQTPQRFLTSKSHTKEPKFCKLYHEASKKSCDSEQELPPKTFCKRLKKRSKQKNIKKDRRPFKERPGA
jgi:hypothetical protein